MTLVVKPHLNLRNKSGARLEPRVVADVLSIQKKEKRDAGDVV
jgi:hypothetical protein